MMSSLYNFVVFTKCVYFIKFAHLNSKIKKFFTLYIILYLLYLYYLMININTCLKENIVYLWFEFYKNVIISY